MRKLALAVFPVLLAAAPAAAQSDDVVLGVRAGVVDIGGFESDDGTLETDLSPSIGGFVDYGFGPIAAGLYADVHGLTGEFDDREYMLDVGAALKAQLGSSGSRAYLRPGIGVGYGTVDVGDGATFLTTRGTIEVVIPQAGGFGWSFEAGAYWAPTGSADDVDLEFGPGLILRAGVIF